MKKMKSAMRRTILMLLAVLMVLSAIPITGALAAATIEITNIYTASERNLEESRVTRVTVGTMAISATVRGIDASQFSNLAYEITNMDTNISRTVNVANALPGSNAYEVIFPEVELTEGLNRIVVLYNGSTTISSEPGWVFFTPAVRIEDIRIDRDLWDEEKIYPSNPNVSTIVDVTGSVYNANSIDVHRYGDEDIFHLNVIGNEFSLYADTVGGWSNADIILEPGDNILTFSASNYTYSYQLEKTLIYDNGDPFAFDVRLDLTNERLLLNPAIDTNDVALGGTVMITGKLKVDLIGNILEYPRVEIIASNNTPIEIDLTNLPANVTENTDLSKGSQYRVFDFEVPISLPDGGIYTVDFNFVGTQRVQQDNLMFTFYNLDEPYVNYVERLINKDDTKGIRLSEVGHTNITEQPTIFHIYTDTKATGVNIYLDEHRSNKQVGGTLTGHDVITIDGQTYHRFTYSMENVLSGSHKLIVVPVSGAGEHDFGKKSYDLQVSSVPYIVPSNFRNGLVVESVVELQEPCDNSTYCLSGRMVNVPDIGNFHPSTNRVVEVFLNTVDITGQFDVLNDEGYFEIRLSNNSDHANSLQNGSNVLSFKMYTKQNGVLVPLTTASYEIFRFANDGPEIIDIEIVDDEDNPKFTPGSVNNSYFTTEDRVRFIGDLNNVTDLKLFVYRNDKDGNPIKLYDQLCNRDSDPELERPNSNDDCYVDLEHEGYEDARLLRDADDKNFRTYDIDLAPRGDTIFEFIVTNETGIEIIQTITIVSESLPYEIQFPRTFTNLEGLPQANVNSNYVEVRVKAEFADAVIYEGQNARRLSNNRNSNNYDIFLFEVSDLRSGRAQDIDFTVVRGQEETKGTLVLNYVNQPIVGAKYKAELKNRVRAFNNMIDMRFARNSSFKRSGTDDDNPYLTGDRKILFGLADPETGEVDPDLENAGSAGITRLKNRDDNFQPASPLYWIDVGTIERNEDDLKEALTGSGRLPYEGRYFYNRYPEDLVVPTERVEITLKYNDSIISEAWRYITVFHFDVYTDSDGRPVREWRNIGGVVDPKKNTITVNAERFGYFQVMYMTQSFRDVVSHDWAKDDIEILYSKGIMGPRNNSSLFRPNDTITRGEFITMLVKIYDIPLNYEGALTFVDARSNRDSNGLWDYRYIETAARAGIVRGVGNLGEFGSNRPLTREQAAVMIARAANLRLGSGNKVLQSLQKSFTDANSIDVYSQASVEAVVKAGIISGKQHSVIGDEKPTFYFDAKANLRRDEAAAIAVRVLRNEKKIPK